MFKIKLCRSHFYTETRCILCGQSFFLEGVDASLWEDNEKIGDVCEGCIRKGAAEIQPALKEHAARLKKMAETLENLAEQDIECPSWEEYKFFEDTGI